MNTEVTTPFPASPKYKFIFFNEETPVRRGLQLEAQTWKENTVVFLLMLCPPHSLTVLVPIVLEKLPSLLSAWPQ